MTNYFSTLLRIGQNGTKHINAALDALRSIPGPFTIAQLPAASAAPRTVVFVTNGDAGKPCLAVSDGTNWLRASLGAAVSATA
jgi:hypothetical protein